MRATARKGGWNEEDHPREPDGKFGDGGGGPAPVRSEAERGRAAASLEDSTFVAEHSDRLSRAGDAARALHGPHEQGLDHVADHALAAIHDEAAAIHAGEADTTHERLAANQATRQSLHGEADAARAAADSAPTTTEAEEERAGDLGPDHHEMESHTAGPDAERLQSAYYNGSSDQDSSGTSHSERMASIAREKELIANETRALDLGHIEEVPHEAANAFEAMPRHIADDMRAKFDALNSSHDDAARAVAELHASATYHDSHEHHGDDDMEGPHERRVSDVDVPERGASEVFSEEEALSRGETYRANSHPDVDTHHSPGAGTFEEHATRAQDALERLHEHQKSTLAAIGAHENAHEKARKASAREAASLSDHALVNHGAIHNPEDLARAKRASASRINYEAGRRDAQSGIEFHDTHETLKDEIRATTSAIKQLSKITGRAPSFAKPKGDKTKKSGNRPATSSAATVHGMAAPAPRYKLKLSKLEFVSPVDTPAQETARVLLIKRGGHGLRAHASVAKVDDSLGLVFCWAFTSTSPDGSAYHDLQGDAIDADFIKAAADFMTSGGGATDEMHDGKKSGQVVFAMPMTPEIAKAYGVETKTTGLMVALRPPPEVLAKFKSGEYTGVSIAGTGVRELAKHAKPGRSVRKMAVLTSEEEGHQHTIDLDDPASDDRWRSDQLSTSYQTSAGAADSHQHAWIYDKTTGAVTIASDSGHTHTVAEVVPAEVLAGAAEREAEEGKPKDCSSCGCECDGDDRFCPKCGASLCGEAKPMAAAPAAARGGSPVVVIAARAPGSKSPPSGAVPTVIKNSQENQLMDPKIAKMIAVSLLLPEAQRVHAAKLSSDEQMAFLGFDASTRESAMAAAIAADPVVYTTKSGVAIRKSQGDLVEKQAKQLDQQADLLAAQTIEITINKAKAEQVELEKRAGEVIPLIGKSVEERVVLLKAASAVTDETLRNGVLEALKGANAAFSLLSKAQGYSPSGESQSPQVAWETGLANFAKAQGTANPLDAIVPFLKTEHGKQLKKSLDALRPNAQPS